MKMTRKTASFHKRDFRMGKSKSYIGVTVHRICFLPTIGLEGHFIMIVSTIKFNDCLYDYCTGILCHLSLSLQYKSEPQLPKMKEATYKGTSQTDSTRESQFKQQLEAGQSIPFVDIICWVISTMMKYNV